MASLPYPAADSTRDEIILAAHDLFVRQGFHGTSMRQISAQAGIALGSIYNHFASKEDIFRAVLKQYHPYREVIPALQSAQGQDIEMLVRDAAARMVQALANRPDFLNLVFIEIVEFNSEHLGEIFLEILPDIKQGLTKILRSDQRVRDLSFSLLIRYFIGLFFSYYMTEKVLNSEKIPALQLENAMDQFVDVFLHGILIREPRVSQPSEVERK